MHIKDQQPRPGAKSTIRNQGESEHERIKIKQQCKKIEKK